MVKVTEKTGLCHSNADIRCNLGQFFHNILLFSNIKANEVQIHTHTHTHTHIHIHIHSKTEG